MDQLKVDKKLPIVGNIEKNISIPPEKKVNRAALLVNETLQKMDVGDSFEYFYAEKGRIEGYAIEYRRNHPGWEYTTRSITSTTKRLWRTA